jgi:hypothetical protein
MQLLYRLQHDADNDASDETNSAQLQDVWPHTDDDHIVQPHGVRDGAAGVGLTGLGNTAARGKSSWPN